jgi:hypothetical protein
MRKLFSASALVLALVCSARAGEMQNDFTGTPPQSSATTQQQTTVTQQPATDGEMQNDVAAGLTQVALTALAVLPSLP